nr:alpha-L-fucosidase [Kibdelosporangium sp. MJ126-NF4]
MQRRIRTILLSVIVLALTLITPTAHAETEHPRQQWLRASTAGLFLHWGMFTAPRHLDCAEWERDVTGGGWTPDYWVDEARKLGASYIVLATFHSRLGYARPWPSAIPGSCSTRRDLLGELVKAGKAKDVKVILYMTDDPQWHSEQGKQMLDSAAYSAHKGQQVDLTTRRGFGMYSYDLFFEVMRNYADLGGFWIDNDNDYWEQNKLYEQIRQLRPSWLLSNNNEDTPIMDTVSNEQKTGMTPSYDYPQAAWTPMPRLVEADYKLPTTGDWWYDGRDHPVDFRLSTGRYVTNAGSSMKSLMAETPMVNGKFPPSQEKFNDFMAEWAPPIRDSLHGTEGGGYMYGGMQPGFWNDGAHGVITVKPGATTQYAHVVTRPTTDMLRIRDNGYWVTGVTNVRTGERLRFNQAGGYLTVLGIREWDTYDTVFKIDTPLQTGYYKDVSATATSARDGFPASNLTDGSHESYWDANDRTPVSVTLDLKQRRHATHLAVNQREWSPTYARVSFGRPEDSARIKDYTVSISDDGVRWRQVRAGAMPSARGTQFIDIGQQDTRYIKLDVLNTWAGPQAPRYFGELQIDEIKVGHGYPLSPWARTPLEAEHASLGGVARWQICWACSGSTQVVGLGGGARNSVTYKDVTVETDGDYKLQLDTTSAEATSLAVSVNGEASTDVALPADRADVPTDTSIPVTLKAGANTITLFSNSARGPGIDRIAVSPLPPASYTPRTTMTVKPHGVQWVGGPGQQAIKVTGQLRLDVDDTITGVELKPTAPAGWSVQGSPATVQTLRLGQVLSGEWTLTAPARVEAVTAPVTASFQVLGRAKQVVTNVDVKPRPADRVFMREAEDSRNEFGSTGLTGCGACSGGEKVRNIGGSPDALVRFDDVTVDSAGQYALYIDFTVNGPRSFFVSVNGGPSTEVKVDGIGNNTPYTTTLPVTLNAGANSVTFANDQSGAPDLDRISLAKW